MTAFKLPSSLTKKCFCHAAAGVGIISALCGCGSGPMDKITQASVNTTKDDYSAADFVVKRDLELRTAPSSENETAAQLKVPEGTRVSVIETKVDPKEGTLVRLGMDVGEDSGLPSDAWFHLDQTLLAGLMAVSGVDSEEDGEDKKTSLLRRISAGARKKMTYCFAYVKRELLSSGKVSGYLPGESAYMAASILPKHGFRRSGNSPASAKVGEVCVYSGGPQGHGHVEIRKAGGWWYGYGVKPNAMTGRNFIACFVK